MNLGEYLGAGAGITKGLWRLNGNSNDASGNGYNGTDTGIAYGLAHGRFGQGASFVQASSSNIALPSSIDTPLANGSFTFGGWFNQQVNSPVVLSRGVVYAGSNYYGLSITLSGSSVIFVRNINTTTAYQLTLSCTVPASVFFFLVLTFDKSNGDTKAYVNGTLGASGTMSSYASNVAYHASFDTGWHLGALMRNLSDAFYTHKEDEVFLENVIWSPTMVQKYYTRALGRGVFAPSSSM